MSNIKIIVNGKRLPWFGYRIDRERGRLSFNWVGLACIWFVSGFQRPSSVGFTVEYDYVRESTE